jgi:hypothetical protein
MQPDGRPGRFAQAALRRSARSSSTACGAQVRIEDADGRIVSVDAVLPTVSATAG